MKKIIFGNNTDKMPDFAFRLMAVMFKISDFFHPRYNYIEQFDIKKNQTVVDFGCGPGRYVFKTSDKVGPTGRVYAVDVHPLAIQSVNNIIQKKQLSNVFAVLADNFPVPIPDQTADLIYALDMFHMVSDTKSFLHELHRLIKKDGKLIIESGHQPKYKARKKIIASGYWKIFDENPRFFTCKPI